MTDTPATPAAARAGTIDALLRDDPDLTRDEAEHLYDEVETCSACGETIEDGDPVFYDFGESGHIHAACCGPERESYCGPDGEPLGEHEPIPEPWIYGTNPQARAGT